MRVFIDKGRYIFWQEILHPRCWWHWMRWVWVGRGAIEVHKGASYAWAGVEVWELAPAEKGGRDGLGWVFLLRGGGSWGRCPSHRDDLRPSQGGRPYGMSGGFP